MLKYERKIYKIEPGSKEKVRKKVKTEREAE